MYMLHGDVLKVFKKIYVRTTPAGLAEEDLGVSLPLQYLAPCVK